MHSELTNLLPFERQRILARDYYVRLGVVVVVFMIGITFAAGVLLVPTYVFLIGSSNAKEMRLANLKSTLASGDEAALSNRLTALSSDITTLTTLSNAPAASAIMRTLLSISRPGIKISSFVYAAAAEDAPGTVAISGTAATRDALRNYQLALQSTPSITSADLPISAFAKDSSIPFTITVTLAP